MKQVGMLFWVEVAGEIHRENEEILEPDSFGSTQFCAARSPVSSTNDVSPVLLFHTDYSVDFKAEHIETKLCVCTCEDIAA